MSKKNSIYALVASAIKSASGADVLKNEIKMESFVSACNNAMNAVSEELTKQKSVVHRTAMSFSKKSEFTKEDIISLIEENKKLEVLTKKVEGYSAEIELLRNTFKEAQDE